MIHGKARTSRTGSAFIACGGRCADRVSRHATQRKACCSPQYDVFPFNIFLSETKVHAERRSTGFFRTTIVMTSLCSVFLGRRRKIEMEQCYFKLAIPFPPCSQSEGMGLPAIVLQCSLSMSLTAEATSFSTREEGCGSDSCCPLDTAAFRADS